MLRLAATRFGIGPEAFWRLSLREWRALTQEEPGPAMGRTAFERLAAAWPDGRRADDG